MVVEDSEIERLIAVRLRENPRPSRGMEEGTVFVLENQGIPEGICSRIDNLDGHAGNLIIKWPKARRDAV